MKYLIISLLFLIGCVESSNLNKPIQNNSYGIRRFENDEVICYRLYDRSLQCHWKNK